MLVPLPPNYCSLGCALLCIPRNASISSIIIGLFPYNYCRKKICFLMALKSLSCWMNYKYLHPSSVVCFEFQVSIFSSLQSASFFLMYLRDRLIYFFWELCYCGIFAWHFVLEHNHRKHAAIVRFHLELLMSDVSNDIITQTILQALYEKINPLESANVTGNWAYWTIHGEKST